VPASFYYMEQFMQVKRRLIIYTGGTMKFQITLLSLMILVASCAPAPEAPVTSSTLPPDTAVTSPPGGTMPTNEAPANPLAPKSGDENLTRGNVFIQEYGLMIRESFPPQVSLAFSGDLPTPCHELRAVMSAPNEENKIMVDAYSVVDPNMVCTQVLKPFQANMDLGTFPTGHYTVWIDGEMAGEFDT
jgi:hypothetical protein